MTAQFTIREVAERTGLSLHTLRYYERIGLIEGVRRADNRHRRYSPEDIIWLEFLKRLRATGMPTSEMKHFAVLRRQGTTSLPERRDMLVRHYERVEAKIVLLQENLVAIRSKIGRLAGQAEKKNATPHHHTEGGE